MQNGFHIPQFRATRGTTQVILASPTLFNVEVYIVVQHWISLTVEDEHAIHNWLGMKAGRSMVTFYADVGLI